MSHITRQELDKEVLNSLDRVVTKATGVNNYLVISIVPETTEVYDGLTVRLKVPNTNTSVNCGLIIPAISQVPYPIKSATGGNPRNGQLVSGTYVTLVFNTDSNYFILQGESGVDTSDATATNSDIILGKTAYVNNSKVTGSLSLLEHTTKGNYVIDGGSGLVINEGDFFSYSHTNGAFNNSSEINNIISKPTDTVTSNSLGNREYFAIPDVSTTTGLYVTAYGLSSPARAVLVTSKITSAGLAAGSSFIVYTGSTSVEPSVVLRHLYDNCFIIFVKHDDGTRKFAILYVYDGLSPTVGAWSTISYRGSEVQSSANFKDIDVAVVPVSNKMHVNFDRSCLYYVVRAVDNYGRMSYDLYKLTKNSTTPQLIANTVQTLSLSSDGTEAGLGIVNGLMTVYRLGSADLIEVVDMYHYTKDAGSTYKLAYVRLSITPTPSIGLSYIEGNELTINNYTPKTCMNDAFFIQHSSPSLDRLDISIIFTNASVKPTTYHVTCSFFRSMSNAFLGNVGTIPFTLTSGGLSMLSAWCRCDGVITVLYACVDYPRTIQNLCMRFERFSRGSAGELKHSSGGSFGTTTSENAFTVVASSIKYSVPKNASPFFGRYNYGKIFLTTRSAMVFYSSQPLIQPVTQGGSVDGFKYRNDCHFFNPRL